MRRALVAALSIVGVFIATGLLTQCPARAQRVVPGETCEATEPEHWCGRLWSEKRVDRLHSQEARWEACIDLVELAAGAGLDVADVVALAWHESKLNPEAVSKGNARGVLQVVPSQMKRWRKRTKGARGDYVTAGLWTWERFARKSKSVQQAVCRYRAGYSPECVPGTKRWSEAGAVVALAGRLRGGE